MEYNLKTDILQCIPSAYTVKNTEYIESLKTDAVILYHEKSGARICILANDDENKMFCAAFKTPPEDDCGTPHIIEHSVLCGSERYPVKDPFMQLVKGSMYTFLNAMTYPDKTVYPVSSCNDADFVNLSNVYLDAVFASNIKKHKEIFMQEGWHYEPTEDGGIDVGGVVYSEMKGAVSSPDSNIYDELIYGLFPDNAYGKNSGGDPDHILKLTYERFVDFYERHYHPSNAYIILYGNVDFEERLNYIDREYLSRFGKSDICSDIGEQPSFGGLRKVTRKYPIQADEDASGKTFLAYGSVFTDALETVDCFAADYLSDILVESPGSPVKTALIDAGIGQEVYGGLLNHMKQPAFSVIAKNTDSENADRFIDIIENTLRNIAVNGINKKSLLAAIERSEFRFKEGEQGTASRGLNLGLGMLQSWMFTDEDPFRYLRVADILKELRRLAETDYFERLVSRIVESSHRSLVVLEGEAGLNEKNSAKLSESLDSLRGSMTDADYEKLCDEYEAFEAYQDEDDTEEALGCIPVLSKNDISKDPQPIYNREATVGTLPAVCHDVPVNGLAYVRFLFDISHVPSEDLPFLDLAVSIFGKADTEKTKYADLLDEIRLNTGGFGINCTSYRKYGSKDDFKLVLEIGLRTLSEKICRAVDIAREVITETKFSDTKRIREILAEIVSEKERDVLYAGSEYASSRALAYFNSADAVDDMIDGISSYYSQKKMLEDFDRDSSSVVEKLSSLVETLFNRNSCLVSVAVDPENSDKVEEAVSRFASSLNDIPALPSAPRKPLGKLNEGFLSSSQVQYVACAGNLFDAGCKYTGAYQILTSMLKNDYLYPAIRMKGGAYGYNCQFAQSTGNVTFSTYRDPCLSESYEVFEGVGDFIRSAAPTEEDINKYVVGTFGKLDRPMTPYVKSIRSLSVYMTGITYDDMKRDREAMLNVTADDLVSLADSVDSIIFQNFRCVIGNEERILKEKELFANTVKLV